jgi:hypothetical protein
MRKGYGIFSELVALILFVSIFWVSPTNYYEEPKILSNVQKVENLKSA